MLTKFYVKMRNKMQEEEGQTLTEYALIIALIAVLLVASLTNLKDGISGVFQDIVDQF